jgi:hypothetical protein
MNDKSQMKNIREAFSYTTHIAGTNHDPSMGRSPFNVVTGMGFLDSVIAGVPARDEKDSKAPKILPFPLDRIVDQLAKSYEELMKTRMTLLISIKSALLSKQEKALLRLDIKYIDACVKNIQKISKDIEKIHL